MVDRTKGLLNISANFEPKIAEPFDGRMRVKTKASLLLPATWESSDGNIYTYNGMIVSVYNDISENNGLYVLKADDYTIEGNWEKTGAGGGTPAGSDGYVQFNDGGSFGADADLYWNNISKKLEISGILSLDGNTSGTIIVGANPVTSSWDFYFPATSGIDGYVLTTDGTGITSWTPGGGGGGGTLNQSYDYGGAGVGRFITADAGAVSITVPDLSNNSGLFILQNDLTNNPNAVEIENNGDGYSIILTGNNKKIAGESVVGLECFSAIGTNSELTIESNVIPTSSGDSHLNLYSTNQSSGDSILDILAISVGGNSDLNITSDSTSGTANIINTAKTDIIFNARSSGQIAFNEDAPNNVLVGFTATSIVGALNELKSSISIPTRIESGNTFAYVRDTGIDGYFVVVTEGSERLRIDSLGNVGVGVVVPTSSLDVDGDVEVGLNNWFYYGDPSTNGTWRTGIVGGEFMIEKRESGLWVTKGTFS